MPFVCVNRVSTETLDAFFVEGIISLETQIIRERGTDFQPYSSILPRRIYGTRFPCKSGLQTYRNP